MEILAVLADPILPVFSIALIGFVLGRLERISMDDAAQINRFAMTVLMPVFVFGLIVKEPITSFPLRPVLVYMLTEALTFALAFLIVHRLFKRSLGEAILLAFCCIFANNALYLLPIVVLLYGPDSVFPVTTIITLDAIITMGITMVALETVTQGSADIARISKNIAKTPLLQAIALAVIVSLAGIPIPHPVSTFVTFTGAGAAPIALFAMGVALSKTNFRPDGTVVTISAIKILLFPLLIWLGLETFAGSEPERDLFLLASAGPAGATAMNFALLYRIRTDAIAQVIIWTGILTLFTLAYLA